MPNVKIRSRFSDDSQYIAEMRYNFEKDPSCVRRGYFELVSELEELLWTERLLREKVLLGDIDSRVDRLWGCQLADFTRNRKIPSLLVTSPSCMDYVGQVKIKPTDPVHEKVKIDDMFF